MQSVDTPLALAVLHHQSLFTAAAGHPVIYLDCCVETVIVRSPGMGNQPCSFYGRQVISLNPCRAPDEQASNQPTIPVHCRSPAAEKNRSGFGRVHIIVFLPPSSPARTHGQFREQCASFLHETGQASGHLICASAHAMSARRTHPPAGGTSGRCAPPHRVVLLDRRHKPRKMRRKMKESCIRMCERGSGIHTQSTVLRRIFISSDLFLR